MRIITKREIIKEAPDCWNDQYNSRNSIFPELNTNAEIQNKLDALDLETCTAGDVDEIIGNNCWTKLVCDCCGRDSEKVILFEKFKRPVFICKDCLEKGLELLKSTKRSGC